MHLLIYMIILSLSSTVFSFSRNDTMDFFNCLACAEDPQSRWYYMKCSEMKPRKMAIVTVRCMKTILPIATSMEDLWPRICKNKKLIGMIHDCITEIKKDIYLNVQENLQMAQYVECMIGVQRIYCPKEQKEIKKKKN